MGIVRPPFGHAVQIIRQIWRYQSFGVVVEAVGEHLPESTPAFDPPESRFWRRKADAVPDGPGAAPDADPSPRRGHRMLFALTVLGALALACWLMPLPFDVDDVVVTVETLAGQAADWFSDLVGRIGELVS